jgi:hypothetical protein
VAHSSEPTECHVKIGAACMYIDEKVGPLACSPLLTF